MFSLHHDWEVSDPRVRRRELETPAFTAPHSHLHHLHLPLLGRVERHDGGDVQVVEDVQPDPILVSQVEGDGAENFLIDRSVYHGVAGCLTHRECRQETWRDLASIRLLWASLVFGHVMNFFKYLILGIQIWECSLSLSPSLGSVHPPGISPWDRVLGMNWSLLRIVSPVVMISSLSISSLLATGFILLTISSQSRMARMVSIWLHRPRKSRRYCSDQSY